MEAGSLGWWHIHESAIDTSASGSRRFGKLGYKPACWLLGLPLLWSRVRCVDDNFDLSESTIYVNDREKSVKIWELDVMSRFRG